MRPIVINWPAENFTIMGSSLSVSAGTPLALTTNSYAYNPISQSIVPAFQMPFGTVRGVVIQATSGSINTSVFTINGLDEYGNYITETITGGSSAFLYGLKIYAYVFTITPTLTSSAILNVGYSSIGTTVLQTMDKYNKNNNYTISYQNVSGTVRLTPYYTINPIYSIGTQTGAPAISTVMTPIQTFSVNPTLYYPVPIANINVINSPTATTPVVDDQAISIIGIPLTGLMTVVAFSESGSTPSGSFTQVILQQGGKF